MAMAGDGELSIEVSLTSGRSVKIWQRLDATVQDLKVAAQEVRPGGFFWGFGGWGAFFAFCVGIWFILVCHDVLKVLVWFWVLGWMASG